MKKVMLCGDSIAKGIMYDSIANKYKKCEKAFAGVFDRIFNWNILNISKFGNTVKKAEKRFYKAFSDNNPDLVIFELGGNDCDFDWDAVSKNPEGIHLPKTDIREFSSVLSSMIDEVSREGKEPVLMNLTPLDPDAYFEWISRKDEERGRHILEWLGSVSKIYWWQERYNSAVQDMAREQGIGLIDVRNEFLKKYDFRDCICEDGIHPNDKGQQLIADAIGRYFSDSDSAG